MIPFVFSILFPGSLLLLPLMLMTSMLGAWWPTRLVCFVFRLTPVILISDDGDMAPGYLHRNAIGTVMAYEGILPTLGDRAHEDGRVEGIMFDKWRPMP